jgi:16S rRNA processing protein RimM
MSRTPPADRRLVCVAAVAAAHGVRGAIRLKTFTESPENVGAYGPPMDQDGRELFAIQVIGRTRDGVVVQAEGIDDRDAAEALRGLRLYVPRARLPEPEADAFYYDDLIGLAVRDTTGRDLGRITGVHNFGAGEVLEYLDTRGQERMLPFSRTIVLDVDVNDGQVTVAPHASEAA